MSTFKPPSNITTSETYPESYPPGPAGTTTSTIPDELPPRPQGNITHRSGLHDFFTFRFLRSYSLRGLGTDKRKRWRRICMIITLSLLTAMAIVDIVFNFLFGLWVPGVVFTIVDVVFIWGIGWSLAVIGDSVGTKKACGLTFGRTFFDVFLIVVCLLYCIFFIIMFFAIGLWGFEGAWVATGLLIFVFSWIASEPPIYPNDVV